MKLSTKLKRADLKSDDWYEETEELIKNSSLSEIDKGFVQGCMETYNDMGFTCEQIYYELISDLEAIDE